MGGVGKHLLSRGNGISMRKQYWIGPPEHHRPSDLIEVWLESGDLVPYVRPPKNRSGSAKLNRSDKCIIGVFSLGKGAGASSLPPPCGSTPD